MSMVNRTEYKVAAEDIDFLKKCIFEMAPYLKDANARDIRTFYEKMGKEQNYRLIKEDNLNRKNSAISESFSKKEKEEIRERLIT